MKTLLFLNGPGGWQTGIEDGFNYLLHRNIISELQVLYFHDVAERSSLKNALDEMMLLSERYLPNLIIFFHAGDLPIDISYIRTLKELPSKPIIVYDDGDMYGGIHKPINKRMKVLLKTADVVSIRGLGEFYQAISTYNKNIIYTPHHADIARFDKRPHILRERKYPIVSIGNRIHGKISMTARIPGAHGRVSFIRHVGKSFPSMFYIFGNGWSGFEGDQGPIDFQTQMEIYKNSWITVAYEHYPRVSYYFSNRLPIALLSGSLYVCHYHEGLEHIFRDCDFIFFFKTNEEAVDIIRYLLSLSKADLLERSMKARKYALKHLIPQVVWLNFVNNVVNMVNRNRGVS
jgi:hypothetical protein